MSDIKKLFQLSPSYLEKRKRRGGELSNDGYRMSPLLRAVYERAVRAYGKKEYHEASNLFVRVLENNIPSSVCSYFAGVSFLHLQNETHAKRYFEKTISLKKNYYHTMYAHIFMAYFALKDNDLTQAADWLRLPVKNNFESPLAYSFMGYIAGKKQQHLQAVKYYERSLARDPQNPSFKNNLGFSYVEAGQKLETAAQLIKEAVQQDKKNAAYLHSWGWLFFIQRRFKQAVIVLTKAFALARHHLIKRDLLLAQQKFEDK